MFFFMSILGRIFFEFKFAKLYLKTEVVKNFGIRGFMKQLVYQMSNATKWKLNWEEAEERQKVRRSMNNMLDIVYLQKRIDFLEKGLSIVLKEHQINGLHLLRGKNRK